MGTREDYSGQPDDNQTIDPEPNQPTDTATGVDPTTANTDQTDGTTVTDDDTGVRKALKDTKRELTRASMENAQLKGRLEALEKMMTSRPQEVQKDYLDELEEEEDVTDREKKLIDAMRKMRSQIGGVLKDRDDFWSLKLDEAKRAGNQDLAKYRDKIRDMRSDPDFDGWTDDQIVTMLKREDSISSDGDRRSGPPGNAGRRAAPKKETERDAIRSNPLFRQVYGQFMKEKKDA